MSAVPLNGLVLAGGRSTRMGKDKGSIVYHSLPQREHLFRLLERFCTQTYYSIRTDQKSEFSDTEKVLVDPRPDMGPFAALFAAFQKDVKNGWLIVACDLPLLNEAVLQELVEARRTDKDATAFKNPDTQQAEPLVTIWEPSAWPEVQKSYQKGELSPKRLLEKINTHFIAPKQPHLLQNINYPEEFEEIRRILRSKKP